MPHIHLHIQRSVEGNETIEIDDDPVIEIHDDCVIEINDSVIEIDDDESVIEIDDDYVVEFVDEVNAGMREPAGPALADVDSDLHLRDPQVHRALVPQPPPNANSRLRANERSTNAANFENGLTGFLRSIDMSVLLPVLDEEGIRNEADLRMLASWSNGRKWLYSLVDRGSISKFHCDYLHDALTKFF